MRPDLPEIYWHNLAAKAITLQEKIDEPRQFIFHPAKERDLEKFISGWHKVFTSDDPQMFENRLKIDNLTRGDLSNLAGPVSFRDPNQLPEWTTTFKDIMGFLRSYDPADLSADMTRLFGDDQDKKMPFLHLHTPLVVYALSKLEQAAGDRKASLFTPEASRLLNLQLARMLGLYTSRTFQLEFGVFKSSRQSSIFMLIAETQPDKVPGNDLYMEFVGRIIENNWQDFFFEYSVLAKIISLLLRNWIGNNAIFIDRLSEDLAEITTHFSLDVEPGKVTMYQAGISDPHNHGQEVISLKFESGLKLMYKSKNLELEQAWSEFINWLNAKGLSPSMKPPDVITKGKYGWVVFIEASDCTSEQDVSDYYRRIGALIGIVYMLNGNDCHMENLIAAGSHPMLIDLETVMHPEGKLIDPQFEDSANSLANSQFGFSVFRTGLLPTWKLGIDGFVFDVSGIGGYENVESPYQRIRWHAVNSDSMKMIYEPVVIPQLRNMPVYQGQIQLPVDHSEEIVAGFTSLYRLVIKHRSLIPIHLFEAKDLRYIFRSTMIYALINKKLMNPKYMRNGLDRSIQRELLSRPFLHNPESAGFWPIYKSEIRQMEDTDIPIFWAESGLTGIMDPYGTAFPGFLHKSAFEQVAGMVSEMDESDIKQQVKFIRAALFFRDKQHSPVRIQGENQFQDKSGILPVSREILLGAAKKIAGKLQSEAIFSKDGSCTWITAGIISGTERFRLQPISFDLYDGLQGVTLFLSALSTISNDPLLQRLNESTIFSLRQRFSHLRQYGLIASGGLIGITSGIASAIYTLLKLSEFLHDPSFVEDAKLICNVITPSAIQKDRSHDITSGKAGCILGMLLLYKQTGFREALEKATLCGDSLLVSLHENKDGTCGWKTVGDNMLSGFSHGQAGIAYALLKLYEYTGQVIYRDTAERAIRYENTLFSAQVNNWADLRMLNDMPGDGPSFMWSWCHGAPGIGLARLASQNILNNKEVDADIRNAINGTRGMSMNSTYRDHLCCGNMGLADMLLYFAAKTGDRDLMIESGNKTSQVLFAAEKTGHYNLLFGAGDDLINPGFFQGISGIGYALLRQAYPEKFPSILIFE